MKVKGAIILFLISISLTAQNYKFGKVSKEELEEQSCSLDASANAAYLYKYRTSFFEYNQNEGFVLITKVHERIKIYNKDGLRYATKAITTYKGSSDEESIYGLKGNVYNLVNGKVEATKLEKGGIFKEKVNKYYNQTKFTLPNVKEGSVLEYKYQISSPFFTHINEYQFQYSIPIKKLEANFRAPEYFNFKVNTKGYLNVIPKKTTKNGSIAFVNKSRSTGSITTTTYNNSKVDFIENIHNYSLSNVPALKREPYVNSMRNYRAGARYELSFTKFPHSSLKYYTTTWDDVVKKIYKSSSFGEELKKTGYFETGIDKIISGENDPKKRMMLIFDYVKSKVQWNNYYGIYPSDVKKAYKNHTGNVADINLMLTSMLRYAGLDANPILVSTRSHGIPVFPTREGYNYVICGVEVLDNIVLLDATSRHATPNVLPFRALNWKGRIVRKSGSSAFVDLYPKEKSTNTVSLSIELDEQGRINGAMRSSKTSNGAMNYRYSYNSVSKEEYLEKVESKYKGIEVSNLEVLDNLNPYKPITENCEFVMDGQADVINDKIFLSPLFFLKEKENPFKLEKREFPIDFGYPYRDIYRYTIKIPEGYKVESIPESKILKLPDNLGDFSYRIGVKGQIIQLIADSKINTSIIPPMYYDAVKAYFSSIIETQNEQVVLTKQ